MDILAQFFQLLIILGILNVWVLRLNQKTSYRGGNSQSLREEFSTYGFPFWFFYLIGALKILFAVSMAIGFWIPKFVPIAAAGLGLLMVGAIISHIKVNDTFIKYVPATIMLCLCGIVFALTVQYLPTI